MTLAWQRHVKAALAPHGLTHVQFVLLATAWWLADHEEPPTQAALSARAGTDPMMTSQVLRRLEDRHLLRRRPDPADARARRIELTADGHEVLRGALTDVEVADSAFFGTEAQAVTDTLGRLAR